MADSKPQVDEGLVGNVHSMETMGLVDGPGIRTIFFLQGCPLRCDYCHNPDTQATEGGKKMTVPDILKQAKRFAPYYGAEGGVTFSGGEPLLQGAFLANCLKALKAEGLSTCIDSSGYGDPRYYNQIFPLVDTILLDVKAFEDDAFDKLIHARFQTFLRFLKRLPETGFRGNIWIRHVMLPGYTDNKESMDKLVQLILGIAPYVERIEILPYHIMAKNKYKTLGREYPLKDLPAMDKEEAKKWQRYVNRTFAEALAEKKKERLRQFRMYKDQGDKHYISPKEREEMKEILLHQPLMMALDERVRSEVMENGSLFRAEKGAFIFKSGDPATQMYMIVEGHVKIYYNTIDGREQIFYIYHAGDFIGGLNVLKHTSYNYMGSALDDCLIFAVSKPIFEMHMMNNVSILKRMLEKSFERVRCAEDLVQRLSASNAAMKVATLLLRLAESFGVESEEGLRLDLSINREEMGSYSGLTRETITRKLGEFKDLGYIDYIGNKVIIIKNKEALQDYSF